MDAAPGLRLAGGYSLRYDNSGGFVPRGGGGWGLARVLRLGSCGGGVGGGGEGDCLLMAGSFAGGKESGPGLAVLLEILRVRMSLSKEDEG